MSSLPVWPWPPALLILLLATTEAIAEVHGPEVQLSQEPWALEARSIPFDDDSPSLPMDYIPLQRASRHWQLCVLYPHLKDAYWLSVNYGMVEEAERLGVSFQLFEAGGYPNLARQIQQLKGCDRPDIDAIILGAVSYEGLTPTVQEIGHQKPIIAAVNDIDDRGIRAKASVPWREMGRAAGEVIARLHPKGSSPVRVAWIPGPKGAGWVDFVDRGFREALADSAAVIVTERFGDTGLEPQVLLVEDVIDTSEDIDYLAGSGPMAEAAVSILRARKLSDRIGVVSTYMSHAVYRGIKRGKIVAAPTDFAVTQGRLAIEMAVRALEGSLTVVHAGPRIVTVTPDTIDQIGPDGSLAPANFSARFTAGPELAPSSSD